MVQQPQATKGSTQMACHPRHVTTMNFNISCIVVVVKTLCSTDIRLLHVWSCYMITIWRYLLMHYIPQSLYFCSVWWWQHCIVLLFRQLYGNVIQASYYMALMGAPTEDTAQGTIQYRCGPEWWSPNPCPVRGTTAISYIQAETEWREPRLSP